MGLIVLNKTKEILKKVRFFQEKIAMRSESNSNNKQLCQL